MKRKFYGSVGNIYKSRTENQNSNQISMSVFNNTNGNLALQFDISQLDKLPQDKDNTPTERSSYTSKGVRKPSPGDPITDKEDLKLIINYFENEESSNNSYLNMRDYAIFQLGITTGLRISDLLKLKIKDVLNFDGTLRNTILTCEQKTGKMNTVPIKNPRTIDVLTRYLKMIIEYADLYNETITPDTYLWVTAKNRSADYIKFNKKKAFDKSTYYRSLQAMSDRLNLLNKYHISTHTLRKTFGYWFYKSSKNNPDTLVLLQNWFNHSSTNVTLKYIGITQEDTLKAYNTFQNAIGSIYDEE